MLPGLRYFAARLPFFGTPPVLIVLAREALGRYYGIRLSRGSSASLVVLTYIVVSLFTYYLDIYKQKKQCAKFGAIPVPKVPTSLPGGIDALAKVSQFRKTGYMGERIERMAEKFGNTFMMTAMFQDRVFTTEPDYIKLILATDFNNYEKGPGTKHQFQSVLGDGVFNADGDMWKFHRSMTRPFFSKDRISHFDMFGRHSDDAITKLSTRLRAGHAVDFQDLVSRFTLDSATEFLFGHCVHSLNAGLPYSPNFPPPPGCVLKNESHPANLFATAFAQAQEIIARRGIWGSIWELNEFMKDTTDDKMKILNGFLEPILKDAIEKKRNSAGRVVQKGEDIEEDVTLLDHLARTTEDIKILKDETLNIMIAGRDTTAGLLTFVVYLLSQHPDVLARLREEILSTVGSKRHPTSEDLREMKFLRAVINETLRLFPSVPANLRFARNATTWPNKTPGGKPYYIPAGVRLIYSVFLMQRRTDLWGPDAAKFDPDRFLDERVQKYITPNPFIFLPFNAGPRICLGQQFAYNEASYMIIRLLQKFDMIDLAPDSQPLDSLPPKDWAEAEEGSRKKIEKFWPDSHLTMFAKGGLWLRMREANGTETV